MYHDEMKFGFPKFGTNVDNEGLKGFHFCKKRSFLIEIVPTSYFGCRRILPLKLSQVVVKKQGT